MATIPQSRIYGAPTPGLQVIRQPRAEAEDPGATALRQVAKGLDEVRQRVQEGQDKIDLSRAEFNATLALDSLQRELEADTELDGDTLSARMEEGVRRIYADAEKNISSRTARQAWRQVAPNAVARGIISARDLGDKRRIDRLNADARLQYNEFLKTATDVNQTPSLRDAARMSLMTLLNDSSRMAGFSAEQRAALKIGADDALTKYDRGVSLDARSSDIVAKAMAEAGEDRIKALDLVRASAGDDIELRDAAIDRLDTEITRIERFRNIETSNAAAAVGNLLLLGDENGRQLTAAEVQRRAPAAWETLRQFAPTTLDGFLESRRTRAARARSEAAAAAAEASSNAMSLIYGRMFTHSGAITPDWLVQQPEFANLSNKDAFTLLQEIPQILNQGAIAGSAVMTMQGQIFESSKITLPGLDDDQEAYLRGSALRYANSLAAQGVDKLSSAQLAEATQRMVSLVTKGPDRFTGQQKQEAFDSVVSWSASNPAVAAMLTRVAPGDIRLGVRRALDAERARIAARNQVPIDQVPYPSASEAQKILLDAAKAK